MFSPFIVAFLFLVATGVGFYVAYLYGRRTTRFLWREYIALIAAPVGGSFVLAHLYGPKILYFFFVSAAVGLAFEYAVGLAYHKTLNRRLHTYSRYSIGGYTSLLTIPLWGVAGVVFWLVSKTLGL